MKINFAREAIANMKITSSLLRSIIAAGIVSGFVKKVKITNLEINPLNRTNNVVITPPIIVNSVTTTRLLSENEEVINVEC